MTTRSALTGSNSTGRGFIHPKAGVWGSLQDALVVPGAAALTAAWPVNKEQGPEFHGVTPSEVKALGQRKQGDHSSGELLLNI